MKTRSRVVHAGALSLEDALTHEHEDVRMFARLASSVATEQLAEWMAAEFNRPNVEPVEVFIVLARWAAQTHASLACQFFDAHAIPALVTMFQEAVGNEYPEVFIKSLAVVKQRRAAGMDT